MAPPGMKPDPNGGFKVAGAHPETFLLEMDNGAKAVIDTETLSPVSWVTSSGKEMVTGKGSIVQCFPAAGTPIKGHFVPEERAKKLSFDRMIYKLLPDDKPDVEYRVDVTLRESSLEYDVIIKNLGDSAFDCTNSISLSGLQNGAKISEKKGYTEGDDKSVSTGSWNVATGKFKENAFYVKIDASD